MTKDIQRMPEAELAKCWHKQVYQAIIIVLDQMAVPKRKYSRPKNLVQMSS